MNEYAVLFAPDVPSDTSNILHVWKKEGHGFKIQNSKFEEHAGLFCSSSVPRSTVSAAVTILLLTFGRWKIQIPPDTPAIQAFLVVSFSLSDTYVNENKPDLFCVHSRRRMTDFLSIHFLFVAPQPKSGLRRLIVEVSRSQNLTHTHTHAHNRVPLKE